MQFRQQKFEDELTDARREVPQWKLSHWKHSSEDTLADVDQQLFDQEGPTQALPPLTDRKYYNEYVNYLDTEIPQIKKQIAVMERKQQFHQQQILDAETKAKKSELAKADLEESRGVTELEKPFEEEEDVAEDDDFELEDDSDTGLLIVLSDVEDVPSAKAASPKQTSTADLDKPVTLGDFIEEEIGDAGLGTNDVGSDSCSPTPPP